MEKLFNPLISALIGAGVTALVLTVNNFFSFRTRIDESLREKRLEVYKILWKETSLLPKWPENKDVTYKNLNELSKRLRDWYFNEGGIYLSTQARKAYEVVQDRISETVDQHQHELNIPITYGKNGEYESIRDACSKLRTQLTGDLESRKRILFF